MTSDFHCVRPPKTVIAILIERKDFGMRHSKHATPCRALPRSKELPWSGLGLPTFAPIQWRGRPWLRFFDNRNGNRPCDNKTSAGKLGNLPQKSRIVRRPDTSSIDIAHDLWWTKVGKGSARVSAQTSGTKRHIRAAMERNAIGEPMIPACLSFWYPSSVAIMISFLVNGSSLALDDRAMLLQIEQ